MTQPLTGPAIRKNIAVILAWIVGLMALYFWLHAQAHGQPVIVAAAPPSELSTALNQAIVALLAVAGMLLSDRLRPRIADA